MIWKFQTANCRLPGHTFGGATLVTLHLGYTVEGQTTGPRADGHNVYPLLDREHLRYPFTGDAAKLEHKLPMPDVESRQPRKDTESSKFVSCGPKMEARGL